MIPMHCFLAAGFEEFIGVLIVFGIIVLKLVTQAQQAAKQKGEQGDTPGRPSPPPRPQATSADKVQSFLDEIARQASGGRPAPTQPPVAPRRPQPVPQARPVRKELAAVAAQRVRDRVRREEGPDEHERKQLEKRHMQSKLEKRRIKAAAAKRAAKTPVSPAKRPAEPQARAGDPARRLDSLLPSDALKRAIILRDVLGPCRALKQIESFRW